MDSRLRFLLALVAWPATAVSQGAAPRQPAVSYRNMLENGLPSVRIVEAILLYQRSVRPESPPAEPDLEAVVADSGARMWLRTRLSWVMVDPDLRPSGKRWSFTLTGLQAGSPPDSADAVVSALVMNGGDFHTERYLLARRPPADSADTEDWVVTGMRDSSAVPNPRPVKPVSAKTPKIDSLFIHLGVGRAAAAADQVRRIFERDSLTPLRMSPNIFEAELTRKSDGIGCRSSHGCIRPRCRRPRGPLNPAPAWLDSRLTGPP